MPRTITIIGGGLAGLALGIGLRQRGIPVVLIEAGSYPRHRVCGEYLSGAGGEVLNRLDLLPLLERHRVQRLQTIQFVSMRTQSPVRRTPVALGISRFKLDAALAEEFCRLGGGLDLNRRQAPVATEGLVRASGRRPHPTENGWRWFGLKAHARGLQLGSDLELHITRDSYVGISRIEDGRFNVCGLFRNPAHPGSRHAPHRPGDPAAAPCERLRGPIGSLLNERLARAEFDSASLCSVAGLSLRSELEFNPDEVAVGDALTMIPPATGNGMSLALESAELAIAPLAAFSRDEISWPEARARIHTLCRLTFQSRLRWARLLQTLMFSPIAHNGMGRLLMRSDLFWNWMFTRTRV